MDITMTKKEIEGASAVSADRQCSGEGEKSAKVGHVEKCKGNVMQSFKFRSTGFAYRLEIKRTLARHNKRLRLLPNRAKFLQNMSILFRPMRTSEAISLFRLDVLDHAITTLFMHHTLAMLHRLSPKAVRALEPLHTYFIFFALLGLGLSDLWTTSRRLRPHSDHVPRDSFQVLEHRRHAFTY